MSTSAMPPNPSPLTQLVAILLPEIELGTSKPAELSPAVDGLEPSDSTGSELSTRELEILRYLPTMLRASDIGAVLHLSVNTVKAHLRSIYRKLGVSGRQAAVVRAYVDGILRPRSSVQSSADEGR
jgi:LuxR family maltose regulon positive regulatory protein